MLLANSPRVSSTLKRSTCPLMSGSYAAERLWQPLLEACLEIRDRDRLLEDLAGRDGYFVPRHHLDEDGRPTGRRRRIEKRDEHMADHAMVPSSHIVTPNTEYSNRGLVEMSRGCPEKCRYCWVSYNYGRLRSYPEEGILDRVDRIATISDRIGFVATAVGDHPKLAEILHECRRRDLNVALSSLRIPAMTEDVLRPLAELDERPEAAQARVTSSMNGSLDGSRVPHELLMMSGASSVPGSPAPNS